MDRRILLVEDDPWVRDSLTLYLRNRGCRTVALSTSEEALEAIQKEKFDVILCDYWLPGMDGLALLQRAREVQPGARRILITACPLNELTAQIADAMPDDCIQKPFSVESIERSLARCIDGDVE